MINMEREALAVRSCRTEFVSHRKVAVRVAPKSRSNDAAAAYQIAARRWNRSRIVLVSNRNGGIQLENVFEMFL